MKKIGAIFKFAVTGVLWSGAFVWLARLLIRQIWNFDILYRKQWQVISRYWNDNGVIVGASDYLFFLTLILLFVVWLWVWRRLYRADYIKMLLAPLEYINNYQLRKYEQNETHVVLKNMSVGEKLTVEDVIKARIKKEEQAPRANVSQDLRQGISQKIIQRKEE